jgi:NAD-dependent dihydropyrimidine dehydrogenase PreA subunit
MKTFRYLAGVTTLRLDDKACAGCGMCEIVCPHGVFFMHQKKARIHDLDGCMECGACAKNCPADAIQVSPGVGCAAYIIQTWIKGKNAASCGSAECC